MAQAVVFLHRGGLSSLSSAGRAYYGGFISLSCHCGGDITRDGEGVVERERRDNERQVCTRGTCDRIR